MLDEIARGIDELKLGRWNLNYPPGHADREAMRPKVCRIDDSPPQLPR